MIHLPSAAYLALYKFLPESRASECPLFYLRAGESRAETNQAQVTEGNWHEGAGYRCLSFIVASVFAPQESVKWAG